MASESAKTGGLAIPRAGRKHAGREKPKNSQEMGLVLAFVVLLVWALYVAIGGLDWPVIGHAIKALMAAIL